MVLEDCEVGMIGMGKPGKNYGYGQFSCKDSFSGQIPGLMTCHLPCQSNPREGTPPVGGGGDKLS